MHPHPLPLKHAFPARPPDPGVDVRYPESKI
jgi:hypothetical protein